MITYSIDGNQTILQKNRSLLFSDIHQPPYINQTTPLKYSHYEIIFALIVDQAYLKHIE